MPWTVRRYRLRLREGRTWGCASTSELPRLPTLSKRYPGDAADDVKSVAYRRARAKLRTSIRIQQSVEHTTAENLTSERDQLRMEPR